MELKLDKKFIEEAVQDAVTEIKQDFIEKSAIDKIRRMLSQNRIATDRYGDVYELIAESLPSVTPKQKVGKWIKTYEPNDAEPCILWMCSQCQNTERGRRSKYSHTVEVITKTWNLSENHLLMDMKMDWRRSDEKSNIHLRQKENLQLKSFMRSSLHSHGRPSSRSQRGHIRCRK